jgi:hypothetical protein
VQVIDRYEVLISSLAVESFAFFGAFGDGESSVSFGDGTARFRWTFITHFVCYILLRSLASRGSIRLFPIGTVLRILCHSTEVEHSARRRSAFSSSRRR